MIRIRTNDATSGPASGATGHTFQVDLRGLVDLLSHHLYSSPRVYLRELLQNAVDAITARRGAAGVAGGPGTIRVTAGEVLRVEDTGIGLTEADVHRFLATIGRSSKRGALEEARRDYLGQFGIGLLACFVVADEITVVTRSAAHPDEPAVQWRASSDGRYTVRALPGGVRDEPGTTVLLTPRPGCADWFAFDRVVELARDYGRLLANEVTVTDGAGRSVVTTETPAVWDRTYPAPEARHAALVAYGERMLGFAPLDVIDLDVPLAGIRGAGFVVPEAVSPALRGGHRVHLKGMLLSDSAENLLPDWAFFVRAVVDADSLRPTASRESLYDDETLAAVRDALGARIRDWLTDLAAHHPERLQRFLMVHHLGVKALARHDDELLALMLPWLPFETTDGDVSLEEFTRRHRTVHLTADVEEFRQLAPIAAAAGLGVVNGGYTYVADLVRRLPGLRPGVVVADLDPDTVTAHLDPVDAGTEVAAAPFVAHARKVLEPLGAEPALRAFHPVSVPALLLDGPRARRERARGAAEASADDLWAGILGALRDDAPRAQLVLNHLNPLVRRAIAVGGGELGTTLVEGLYGQALLLGRRPLGNAEQALLGRAFLGLLEHAAHTPATGGGTGSGTANGTGTGTANGTGTDTGTGTGTGTGTDD